MHSCLPAALTGVALKLQQGLATQVGEGTGEVDMLHWVSRGIFETVRQAVVGCSFDPLIQNSPHPFERAIKSLTYVLQYSCARSYN